MRKSIFQNGSPSPPKVSKSAENLLLWIIVIYIYIFRFIQIQPQVLKLYHLQWTRQVWRISSRWIIIITSIMSSLDWSFSEGLMWHLMLKKSYICGKIPGYCKYYMALNFSFNMLLQIRLLPRKPRIAIYLST